MDPVSLDLSEGHLKWVLEQDHVLLSPQDAFLLSILRACLARNKRNVPDAIKAAVALLQRVKVRFEYA
jgi:hypothetical protein